MMKRKADFASELLGNALFKLADASYPNGSPWSSMQWLEDLALPHSHYFIYEENEQIVGALACHSVCDEVEVMQVMVHPNQQQKGIGQQLMQALEEYSKIATIETIFLEVRVSNETAKSIYQKNGFEVAGIRKNYYYHPTEDALVMLKKVR